MKKWNLFALACLFTLTMLLFADILLAQAGRPQASSGPSRSQISRMQDEHDREDRTLGKLVFKPTADGFDVEIEKKPMNPFSARPYLNGKKLKNDQCRGDCSGTLKVIVNRIVYGQRFIENCSAPAKLPAVAHIIIPPNGGVTCFFETTYTASASTREIKIEALDDWEMQLTSEDFIKAGNCLDEHDKGSKGFASCLEGAGIVAPPQLASQR